MEDRTLIAKLSAAWLPVAALHADAHCLVLDKPAGLLCVPGRGADKQDCLSARVQAAVPDARVVHRLDMATSGLVLMARGAEAQRALSREFAERRVHKRYQAIVAGCMESEGWSEIDLPLIVDWPNRPRSIVDHARGKPSLTRWRVLDHEQDTTRLELEPVTGRSHQLRVHLQALGHPIVGDALYAPAEVVAASTRLLLHASRVEFAHPVSGEQLVFSSAPAF